MRLIDGESGPPFACFISNHDAPLSRMSGVVGGVCLQVCPADKNSPPFRVARRPVPAGWVLKRYP